MEHLCFQSIFDHTNLGVAIYEANPDISDFKIIYINPAAEKIESVIKNEIIGKNVSEIFPYIKDFGLFDIFIKVYNSGKPEHFPTTYYRDRRISGWRDNHVSKLSHDKIVSIYTDETKKIERNKKLKEYDYFYRTIFETIQDGITVLDNELNIIKMNQAMEKWYSPEKPYIGKKCYNVYHKKKLACEGCPAKKAIDTGCKQTTIVNRGGPLGTPGWIELSAHPIINEDGYTVGAVEYVRNITARKTAEDDLINSEKQLKEVSNHRQSRWLNGFRTAQSGIFNRSTDHHSVVVYLNWFSCSIRWSSFS
jgi:PAS domain S-box-containing protein